MKLNKIIYSLGLMSFLPYQVMAIEYVPPPTGPYESSIVINKKSPSSRTERVYKFPSDSLIQSDRREEAVFLSDTRVEVKPKENKTNTYVDSSRSKDSVRNQNTQPLQPELPSSANPVAGGLSTNPWAPVNLPAAELYQQNYYQENSFPGDNYQGYSYPGYPNSPQYVYPQQYPNAYDNQYNFMNDPFRNMPSPWSGMSMQPFFSGR